MDERPTKRQGPILWLWARSWRFRIAMPMLAILMGYVGSYGPAWWLTNRSDGTQLRRFRAIYRPILVAARNHPATLGYVTELYAAIGRKDGRTVRMSQSERLSMPICQYYPW
jgi:hypothetical protein